MRLPGVLDLQILRPSHGRALWQTRALAAAAPYKVRANSDAIPFRWELGTLNHEGIAGITACVDYLAELGRRVLFCLNRRQGLLAAYVAIEKHERALMAKMIDGLLKTPG